MSRYLVISDETDSVVAEGSDLTDVVFEAVDLGYESGYVTNQDGGRADLEELIDRFSLGI